MTTVFEANKKKRSSIGNKTTTRYQQIPIFNAFFIISELEHILKSCYNESPLGYDNIDW